MAFYSKRSQKNWVKDATMTEMRKKLCLSQAQFGSLFGVSREYITLAESGKRNLDSGAYLLLANMYLHFHELETGKRASPRSVETKLFLNEEYRRIIPKMKTLELEIRNELAHLKTKMEEMKERAEDAERTIIVFSAKIDELKEQAVPGSKTGRLVERLQLYKQQAYENLIRCWEPEQAKLHGKIEALAGEAKALRRYRIKVTREHNPFKK